MRGALAPLASTVAGFATQRLTANGGFIGYRAVVVNGTTGQVLPSVEAAYSDGTSDGVFILEGKGDISVLAQKISEAERVIQNPSVKLVLLDEIGGIELTSKVFMEPLLRILCGAKPCIGTFKSTDNLTHTVRTLKIDAEYHLLHQRLEQILRQNGNLLTVTEKNRQEISERIRSWITSGKL